MSKWRKGRYGWTKDAWLAYREWAERWERWAMNQSTVYRIVAEMCEILSRLSRVESQLGMKS